MSTGLSLSLALGQTAYFAGLTISGTAPGGTVGAAYSFTPTSTGGRAPKTYALTGVLPDGLSFSTSTGAITGTPTTAGTTSGLDITVTDADALTASLGSFSIVISAGSGFGQLDGTDPNQSGEFAAL